MRREDRPPTTRRILATTAAATTCGVLPAFLLGSQAVQIADDLRLDEGQIGAMVACAWVTAAACSSPLGRTAERVGGARTLRLAALASAAVQGAIAVGATSAAILAALVALGGIVNAATQPAANLLVARTVPADRHGLAFAVKQSAIPLATLLGGVAVPALALTVGWRWSYAVGAAIAVGAALALPRDDHGPGSDPPAPSPSASPTSAAGEGDPGTAPLAVLACGVGLGAAAAGALTTFLPTASVDAGLGEGAAGLLLTLGSAIGIAVRLSMGARADRVARGQLGTVVGMLLGGAAAFAGFALDVSWVYVMLTPVAFGAGWSWPGLFNLSVVRAYPGRPASATGATQTGTYLGAGGGPLVVGWVADRQPWPVAWATTSALAVGGAVAVLAGRAAIRRRRPTGTGAGAGTVSDP